MTEQQQQQQQPAPPQPQQAQQPQQVQQPAPPQPQPSMITFNTTAPEPQPAPQYFNVQNAMQDANREMNFTIGANGTGKEDAYQAIIAQQQAQIDALIAQTNAQSAQITQMVQNGAQFGQPAQQVQQMQQAQQFQQAQPAQYPNVYQPADMQAHPLSKFNPASLANDEDYSLESLAKDIGKRE